MYADIVLWLKNSWVDYVVPQLYFEFGHKAAPYEILLDWWSKHSYGRQCYIGLGIYRAGYNAAWRDKNTLPRQIQALRALPEVSGEVYFSSKSFEKNPNGWSDSLRLNYYKYPALVPPMPWLDSAKPEQPSLKGASVTTDSILFTLQAPSNPQNLKFFVIQNLSTGVISHIIALQTEGRYTIALSDQEVGNKLAFYYISKNNVASLPKEEIHLNQDSDGKIFISKTPTPAP